MAVSQKNNIYAFQGEQKWEIPTCTVKQYMRVNNMLFCSVGAFDRKEQTMENPKDPRTTVQYIGRQTNGRFC